MRLLLRVALLLLMLAFVHFAASAQGHDSKGTQFWIAFLENFGSLGDGELSDLRLYAACDSPATVQLTYHATGEVRAVTIDDVTKPKEIDVAALFGPYVELTGFEVFSRKSILVESDREITLYGVNVRTMSADAFLALPDDILTGRYVAMAYQNGMNNLQGFNEIDMPSELCVIATEDDTEVRVTPSAPIYARGDRPFTVMLDRGEVYFAQAELSGELDLSGTILQATKPVAVFSGCRRTSIPANIGNFRDHLVEQMPPIEVWGNEAIVTPHFKVSPQSEETAVVRILAATDGTNWTLDGVKQQPLMSSRPVELPLTRAMSFKAERPIIVAQYEHSVNASDEATQDYALGDPFMMLVPPPEQFDTAYTFQSVAHAEFLRHFVNIVVPRSGVASLRLDGAPVTGTFVPVPGTAYGYIQFELDAGAHRIRCDSAFGLFAYGYGRANSYGYTGGMAYRQFIHDYLPPDLEQVVDCGRIVGVVFDARVTDTGIDSCYEGPGASNVRMTIESFVRAPDTVHYTAELIDPYLDGVASIRAIDSTGRSRSQVTPIPGFTVRAVGSGNDGSITLDTLALFNGAQGCRTFELVNDGRYPQTISTLATDPVLPSITMATALPLTLQPGESRSFELCANSLLDTHVTVSVLVGTSCISRRVAVVAIATGIDTLGPRTSLATNCGNEVVLTFSEPGGGASGIVAIEIDELVNCHLVEPDPIMAPMRVVERRLVVDDARHDAFVAGTVVDFVGNRTLFRDTIAGFTCAVIDAAGDTVSLAFDNDWRSPGIRLGDEVCDSLPIVNYGVRTQTIVGVHVSGNVGVSVPPAQLPIVLAPGEWRNLEVCLDAEASGRLIDSLTLIDECGRFEKLALVAPVAGLVAVGGDRCNTALSVRSMGAAKRTFLSTPVPNPSSRLVHVDIGLSTPGQVTLEIFDGAGRPAHTIMRGEPLAAGLHRVVADIGTLEIGRYYLRLQSGATQAIEPLVVIR